MSGADSFFDTSVLLYVLSSENEKADRIETLLAESGVISVQVLNEFTAVAIRKLAMPLADIREILEAVRNICRTEPLTVEDHDRAVEIMERYKFSFYDSVIVASALRAACKILYTEDLQHGQVIARQLEVINPFDES
ncbi:MAG: PIN domain-containing protein [Steroidobacteraceae bacterium]